MFVYLFLYIAQSQTCNPNAAIPRRYCCNTDYCNKSISIIQTNLVNTVYVYVNRFLHIFFEIT